MRENKNGFTLVEILGAFVLLAVIFVISVPLFTGIIETVRKNAVKATAIGLLESADAYYAKNMMKIKEPIEFVISNGVQYSKEKLQYKGSIENAYLMLFKNNNKAVCADDGRYAAVKGINDKEVQVSEGNCLGYDEEYKSYIVGDVNQEFTNLDVKAVTDENKLGTGMKNSIRVVTNTSISDFYVSSVAPEEVKEGLVWVVQANNSPYYLESNKVRIGVSYVMQYESGKWNLKKAYVYNEEWKLLYYVDMTDNNLNLENSNLGDIKLETNYEYTGEYQEFTATFSGYYNIQLWGAQGGVIWSGGKGAYTSGDIYLNAGDTIYIYVGGTAKNQTAGWNGGGTGGSNSDQDRRYGYGGGGATDIRLVKTSSKAVWNEFNSLKSRIMVAAGGGGDAHRYNTANGAYNSVGYGGAGGGLTGYNGFVNSSANNWQVPGNAGIGGTQSMPGYIASSNISVASFGFGKNTIDTGAGGGGGYYGGGSSHIGGVGGAGGSSYISGHNGCNSIVENSTTDAILHNGSAYHYSNFYFINTKMIDGQGYEWTSEKSLDALKMPTYDASSTMVGNTGNGYAKIKLNSVQYKSEDEINREKNNTEKIWNYSYSGSTINIGRYQEFVAPSDGEYTIETWGAQGGVIWSGGKGAYAKGKIYLNKGTKLYIYVGGTTQNQTAGWNGGGTGGSNSDTDRRYGYGGGGATDIRLVPTDSLTAWNEFNSLKSRIMVAAGGGGDAHRYNTANGAYNSVGYGGAGGGLTGYNGFVNSSANNWQVPGNAGIGGTQSMPGYVLSSNTSAATFGVGRDTIDTGAGGGGGYYGGGSSHIGGVGAGGGSSYISGHNGCNSITKNSTSTEILHNGSAFHYNGYYFVETKIIDGQGYDWSTYKNTLVNMPTYSGGGLMTGNSGAGYAKITLNNKKKENEIKKTETKWNYDYSGSNINVGRYQEFIAPSDGEYTIEAWGAQGGVIWSGGKGAYTKGTIYLKEGTKLYIYVGGTTQNQTAGWNGGGAGGSNSDTDRRYGYGGGGATDIRLVPTDSLTAWNEFNSLKSRIMVAAGGGGDAYRYNTSNGAYNSVGYGGAGGGLTGYNGFVNSSANGWQVPGNVGIGAEQAIAGYPLSSHIVESMSGFGYSKATIESGAGGGGGYYGGGSSHIGGVGAGGGSSYISGHNGCNSLYEKSTETYLLHSGSAFHYSKKYFVDTLMIDGKGYAWSSYKNDSVNMPVHSGNGTMDGNTGAGYVIITQNNKKTENSFTKKEVEWNYSYAGKTYAVGSYQEFITPSDGEYTIEAWGAQGGKIWSGGLGAYTKGTIYLKEGTKLYIYVGGTTLNQTAGWNGGGTGKGNSDQDRRYGYGGGGATDIRIVPADSLTAWNEFDSLKSRIMVAAGGGGDAYRYNTANGAYYSNGYGGAGGGLIGYNGYIASSANGWQVPDYVGTGGTQSVPGFALSSRKNAANFGQGATTIESGAGGGGGYYGGGASHIGGAGGGGGSSYISGHTGCSSIDDSSTSANIIHNGSEYNSNNYYFTNTVMIDGSGYTWNEIKQGKTSMPTQDGTGTMDGNLNSGYVRIKQVNTTTKIIETPTSSNWNYGYAGVNAYDGNYQMFTAPKNGTYKIELWGSQGGIIWSGGKGGYTSGEINLTKGTKLYIYVGGNAISQTGGWNGGGTGKGNSEQDRRYGQGGGGSTDIRTVKTSKISIWNELSSLKSRIMVAAGGGGDAYRYNTANGAYYSNGYGGSAGGLIGYDGYVNSSANGWQVPGNAGTGGTQSSPGYTKSSESNKASFGIGQTTIETGAGGGSGWYGGGASHIGGVGAGGGSSYISGHAGSIAIDSSGNPKTQTYSSLSDSVSYTGYKFVNTQIIDGTGYPWTTVKSTSSSGMPSPTSSVVITGNTGNGYARITYLGE